MEVEIDSSVDSGQNMMPCDVVDYGSKHTLTQNQARSLVLKCLRFHTAKVLASILMLLFIAQTVYIFRFRAGLIRVANDPVDVILWHLSWDSPGIWEDSVQSYIHNAAVVPVHSHNDYFRRVPLFEALASGCISVEADVHLSGSELLIGHSGWGLKRTKTLRSMYLDPLRRMIEAQNEGLGNGSWRGIFNQAPEQTLVLLVDIKTAGPATFAELSAQLQPLRDLDLLTYWNGTDRIMRPLTVVGSGNTPFDSILALDDSHRDIFLDAPLNFLGGHDDFSSPVPRYRYNQSNSYLASTKWMYAKFFTDPDYGYYKETPFTTDLRASHMVQAKARGLISRYWDLPTEPPNLKEAAWRVLMQYDIGLLNMDDLGAVRARSHGWGRVQA